MVQLLHPHEIINLCYGKVKNIYYNISFPFPLLQYIHVSYAEMVNGKWGLKSEGKKIVKGKKMCNFNERAPNEMSRAIVR